jgi:predicted transposase/invertase (TIGR01784 family)
MKKLIRFDWALKKLLRHKANFDILEGFLSELLKQDIRIESILESETNKDDEGDKFNRVDLLARDSKDELVLIEVQVENQLDFFQRMHYYASKAAIQSIRAGDPYSKVKKIYSVNILYFDLGHGKDYVYHGTTKFMGIHYDDELNLSERQKELYDKGNVYEIFPEYYLLKINQFNEIAKDSLDEWIYFLKTEEIKDGFKARGLKEAKKKLDIMKMSDEERSIYDRYIENNRYKISLIGSNRDEAKLEGFDEGRIAGLEEGIEQGKLLIAKNLKKSGLDSKIIAEATGLSIEDIEKL